jgi:uncharacterized membrane protein
MDFLETQKKQRLSPFEKVIESASTARRRSSGASVKSNAIVAPASEDEIRERAYELANGFKRKSEKPQTMPVVRFEELDFARGIAICLMILSHGVKGLMTFEQMPAWGLVPVHLITKFSSSLFIIAFGMALAFSFVPSIGTESWPKRRKKLLVRGLVVFFWYKALTILEMSHLFGREEIISALTYKTFPVYVEILGFYSIALLWIPWVLPLWKKIPLAARIATPVLFVGLSIFLTAHFDFFGSDTLRAILVEHENYYTWGQFTRAPLVCVGLLLGAMMQTSVIKKWPHYLAPGAMASISLLLFGLFYYNAGDAAYPALMEIAKNAGKHPPELLFMLFSVGGAFLVLALSFAGGKRLASTFGFVTSIGKKSLQAFVFHIVVLFVFYRFLFDYFHKVEYSFALTLSCLLIGLTYCWLKTLTWVKENS